jgi:plasmid stabilization system protein ParE
MKIEFKPEFFDDLDDIFQYISDNFDEILAAKIVREIYEKCVVFAENPSGRKYSRDPYFQYKIILKKNIVFYHLSRNTITFHRIFDGRRDYIGAIENYREKP